MSLLILFIIAVCLLVCAVIVLRRKKEESAKYQRTETPTHFDLLDDNGEKINSSDDSVRSSEAPHIQVVIGSDDDKDAPVKELRYFCVKDKGYNVSVWPKDQGYRGIDYIEFRIAGITHYDARSHIGECMAMLKPEPDNPYDSNAIAIFATDGKQLGHVPKDMTDEVRQYTQLPSFCYCYIGCCQGTLFSDCYISDALKVSPS